MATQDLCCTIVPYFKIHAGKIEAFKGMCQQCMDLTLSEPKCLYYGFSFNGDQAHCREGYQDAEGLLTHLKHISSLLSDILTIAELTRLEVHGPEVELAKLRGPLAELKPEFFVLEYGFRR